MSNSLKSSLSLAILLISIGCSAMHAEHPKDRVSKVKKDKSSMPDVSIQRCLDDGYKVVEITKGGIPVRYLCTDPETGQKCAAWAYYRGSCRLTGSAAQSAPSNDIRIKSK